MDQAQSLPAGDSNRVPAEYAILGLLLPGPNHGYELIRHFDPANILGQIYHLEMSMLYALLKKLEREELITGNSQAISAHKSRRIVSLTPAGHAEFINWLKSPVRKTREIRLEFLLKFYFASQLDPQIALRLLADQQQVNQELLANQHAERLKIGNQNEGYLQELVLDLRIEQNEAVLRWLTRCQLVLQKRLAR